MITTTSPRVLALLAALAALFMTNTAFAVPAPMCDEHAQSIAAPFPIFPSDNGEARATAPCETRGHVELGQAPTRERHNVSAGEVVERLPPVNAFGLPRDRGRRSPPGSAERQASRSGFGSGVFRPPRAR